MFERYNGLICTMIANVKHALMFIDLKCLNAYSKYTVISSNRVGWDETWDCDRIGDFTCKLQLGML